MSILKKASKFRNKKLDASIANYSKVEISPGLFVKRPSSKTKMPPPAPLEPNTYQKSQAQQNILPVVKAEQIHEKNSENNMSMDIGLESPQMPKLKTIDLKKIMKEKKVNEPVLGEIIFCIYLLLLIIILASVVEFFTVVQNFKDFFAKMSFKLLILKRNFDIFDREQWLTWSKE